jgi:hypothetical protein
MNVSKILKNFTLLLLLWNGFSSSGQTHVYDPRVKSIQLHRDGFVLSKPWIRLNSDEQLLLSFDILDEEEETMYYTFVHCDADGEPDELQNYEFVKGFQENEIEDINASFQMEQDYQHYSLLFPNENIQLTKSGNYKIIIYKETLEEPLFEKSFWIVEQKVNIEAQVIACTASGQRQRKQEIRFEIKPAGVRIYNPYDDISIAIMQNGDWQNRITDIQPKSIIEDKINYEYDGLLCINGLNEYRQFNTKSLYTQSERVKRIYVKHDSVQVELFTDKTRNNLAYFQTDDIDGECFIGSQDRKDFQLESEYVLVHFSLESRFPVQEADVYIYGALSGWQVTGESKMQYDYQNHRYHNSLYLKQGIYDYQYLVVNKKQERDYVFFENTHSETQNQYTIFVYFDEPGSFYQRLIGIKSIESYER